MSTKSTGVLVIGGGVAGIQAALDLAESDIKVYLVERSPCIGGRMAQLDKTFPTNDCSMCILSPKLVEVGRHPNIELLTYSEVLELNGTPGDFSVKIKKHPRYVDINKCIGCGLCAEKCPSKVPNEFDMKIVNRKAIYVPFPQGVPLKYTIDAEYCKYLLNGKCGVCKKICPAEAIDYEQQEEIVDLNVGSIIYSPGFEQVNPTQKSEYGWEKFDNVVTGLEFERMMSASGPFEGHIKRFSDSEPPKKIAFLQCVGSRDSQIGKSYCSTICCMYSTKEAIITKEHMPDSEISIFFMDMRAMGKEFDDYYTRAQDKYGIKYIRFRVQGLIETDDKNLVIHYQENGEVITEEFDLAVLAMGMQPTEEAKQVCKILGIELNHYDFCKTSTFTPLETTQPGIFTVGAISGPKDIPDSVAQASGAAAKAGAYVSHKRGEGIVKKEYPPEKDISEEPPRIGALICNCGINIGGVVDVPSVVEYAKTLPNVVYAEENLYTCSQDTQEKIKEIIIEHNLNRVIVAACTPRTHEPLFQNTIREAGLNAYLFDMANIRDQCSWVHSKEPEKATEKAKDLVRMAVANANLLKPIAQQNIEIKPTGLVIGGGLAGMTAALELAAQGFKVNIVEKESELGGNLRHLHYLLDAQDLPEVFLKELIDKIEANEKIDVYLNSEITRIDGHIGDFTINVDQKDGNEEIKLKAGAIIIATGGTEYQPTEYLYGQNDRVVTQLQLEEMLASGSSTLVEGQRSKVESHDEANLNPEPQTVVMIQCVGSRDENNPWCSKVCCSTAVKNALKLKELDPSTNIYVLYKDIRTYGFREDYYEEASRNGIRFIRYDDEHKPQIRETDSGALEVTTIDFELNNILKFNPDLLVLSAGIVPAQDNPKISRMLKVPLTKDGFFLEAHMKLRPVDFGTEGVFLCGLAHSPKPVDETISQAAGAAARAIRILSKSRMEISGVIAVVEPDKCVACLTCVRVCPYNVPEINEDGIAVIDPAKCQGCGTCVGECPGKAIELEHYRDEQIFAKCDHIYSDVDT
jgi:heterodisulfide reductase subunit A